MRNLVCLLALLALSGCASLQGMRDATNSRLIEAEQAEKAEIEAEQRANIARMNAVREREARKRGLKPGLTEDAVTELWGTPDRTEYINGHLVWNYRNDNEPLDMAFKDGKLVAWVYDREAAARIQAAIAQERANVRYAAAQEQAAQAAEDAASSARTANIISAIGAAASYQQQNRPVQCVTTGRSTTCR